MESDKNKQEYPPPPDYFKEFTSPNKYLPPKLSSIQKMNKLVVFGSEYSINDINISYNPINVKNVGEKLIKASKPPNIELFQNLKFDSDEDINLAIQKLNIIDEIENEIKFLRKRYERVLEDIATNVNKAGNLNKITLIGMTLQKINFYLIALRRKAILKKTIDFYSKQIKDCEDTKDNVDNNIRDFRKYLEEEFQELNLDK